MFEMAVDFFDNLTSNYRAPSPASDAFINETKYDFLVNGPSQNISKEFWSFSLFHCLSARAKG